MALCCTTRRRTVKKLIIPCVRDFATNLKYLNFFDFTAMNAIDNGIDNTIRISNLSVPDQQFGRIVRSACDNVHTVWTPGYK